MKKQLISLLCVLLGAALGIGCYLLVTFLSEGRSRIPAEPAVIVPSASAENEELIRLSYAVCDCLRSEDYEALSAYVHPVYGLIFSPYSTINLTSNQCFTANRVSIIGSDPDTYTWGLEYGSAEPIRMTSRNYIHQYVYDRDYAAAPIVGLNDVVRSGNALENVSSIFPESRFVDLYYPPSTSDGTDWSILRLVFEDYEGTLKLSALIHSSFTE